MSIAHGIKSLGVIGAGQMGMFDLHTTILCAELRSKASALHTLLL